MTYEVQQTRWDRLIRRVSGSIGPGSRVSETISELFPVIDVERVPGELLILAGTNLAHAGSQVTAAAAEIPNVILFNPPGSNNLITVTQVAVRAGTNDIVRFAVSSGVSGARTNTERFRDARLISPTGLPVGQISTFSNPSQIAEQVSLSVLANDSKLVSDQNGLAVLSPDTKFVVATTSVQTTMTVTFWWRERPAEVSELQF